MTRVESKGVLKRGKKGTHLRDYSTVVDDNTMKYVLTYDHIELYNETEELTDVEIERFLKYANCSISNIYDN